MKANLQQGFGLLELVVAIAVLGIALGTSAVFVDTYYKSKINLEALDDLLQESFSLKNAVSYSDSCMEKLFKTDDSFSPSTDNQIKLPKIRISGKKIKELTPYIDNLSKVNLRTIGTAEKWMGELKVQAEFEGQVKYRSKDRLISYVILSVENNRVKKCSSSGEDPSLNLNSNLENAIHDCKTKRKKLDTNNNSFISRSYSCGDVMGKKYSNAIVVGANCTGIGGLVPRRTDARSASCFDVRRRNTIGAHARARSGLGVLLLTCCKL